MKEAISGSHAAKVTRRVLLKGAAAGALAGTTQKAWSRQANDKPNIIFLLADDMGYADVSCYGRPDLSTPAIDSLAKSGIRLVQGYANSSVCSATRTALITGRYQDRLRIGLEEPLAGKPFPQVGLPPDHPTLPSLLKKVGYGTMLIGKWHLGDLPEFDPMKSGYDHFWGFRGGALDYFTHEDPGHHKDLWDDETPITVDGYMTDLIGNRAVEAIRGYAQGGHPFFLSVHFNAPHWPWEGPNDRAEGERLHTKSLFDYDGGSQKTYQAIIRDLDRQVGRILRTLDDLHIAQNTIVVFTSDNGGERYADTWPFTGKKMELLEGGLRIPALISWPAKIRGGQVLDQVNITMDWLPTLLAAAGTEPDSRYPSDGMNLLPFFVDGAPPVPRKLFWRYKANAQRAARDGDFKILKILDNTFLFNVVEDPLERANLKNRHPEIYNRMVAEWNAWNATMLPEVKESFTAASSGDQLADHFGVKPLFGAGPVDDGVVWPAPPNQVGR
jgi:arylsulfatase A-like enzyme